MKFIEKHIIQESVPVPKMLEAFNIYMVKKKKSSCAY
jgi:NAD-dependent histone deacetylase SIR2